MKDKYKCSNCGKTSLDLIKENGMYVCEPCRDAIELENTLEVNY